MPLLKSIYTSVSTTIIDALFPIPVAERWIFDTDPSLIFNILPRDSHSPIADGCAIFSYKDERTWRLVWSIKYKKSAAAAKLAGYALHRMLHMYTLAASPIIVVPMPVSKQRRRERGFNQCELLTAEIEQLENKRQSDTGEQSDARGRLRIINDLLIRKIHTSRQTLKDKEGRQESAEGLFGINEKALERLRDGSKREEKSAECSPTIIIIDDVITTGSTMKEAVQTLRSSGFVNTWGLSVAH